MKHLTHIDQLNDLLEKSDTQPVFLFKHSTRCPVSTNAQTEYLEFVEAHEGKVDVVFTHLDLIQYRMVSDAIAEGLKIDHQSPQVILVKDWKAVWHASHNDINKPALQAALNEMETE